MILDSIQDVVHTAAETDSILLYDLQVLVTSQVKFFQVKADDGSL
jgi:hypothetical protein